MLSLNLGPLAISTSNFVLLLALLIAMVTGYRAGRRKQTGGIGHVLSDMFLLAALVARIVFVALWFETYRQSPWSMLDIRDGGFSPWAGVLTALLVALWHGWRRVELRQPLAWGLAAGAVAWGLMSGLLVLMQNPGIPKTSLMTMANDTADLSKVAGGQPLVVNLWATWCPPCRAEMPVLEHAQTQETGMRFVFVNQGEYQDKVQRYLRENQLELTNVLLDPGSHLGREIGSMSLPITLFYDASGQLVDTHVGALSQASLAAKLLHVRPSASH